MGFALGLYNAEVRQELLRLAVIRNRFAHSMQPVLFSDEEITKLCAALSYPAARDQTLVEDKSPRAAYVFSCTLLMAFIVAEVIGKPAPTGPYIFKDSH